MIVRVARRAALSTAATVVVAADDASIVRACAAHGIDALLTAASHASGSDRLAEAARLLALSDADIVVNVQGDEPMIEPSLIDACAGLLLQHPASAMGTAAQPIVSNEDFENPNVVKVVLDATGHALYFSRAPIPWPRDGVARAAGEPTGRPLRHVGIYAYRAAFLRRFPELERSPLEHVEQLEQLRVLWHGEKIAVHVSDGDCGFGIDTPDDLARARAAYAANGASGFA